MAITEESRHHLYQALERVLGSDEAATLMEHLPPVGWADVTTKRDLDVLEDGLEAKIDALGAGLEAKIDALGAGLEAKIDAGDSKLRVEMYREMRNQLRTVVATNLAVGSLVVAAIRLL